MTSSPQFCTFFLDDLYFGIEVQQVQELIRCQPMTRVPLASRMIGGLLNLRGQIVTAIDLRKRLGITEKRGPKQPMNVVVRTDDGVVSLLVDEIGDVIDVDSDRFETPPETLRGPARKLVQGAYKLDDRLLLVLNTAEATLVPAE
jgi:purine-binding chemotaxis protein CheW